MLKFAVVPVAVVAALAATTPSEEMHRQEAASRLSEICNRLPLGRHVCGDAMTLVSGNLDYQNHLLWSTGRLGRVQTFGILGQVMVVEE